MPMEKLIIILSILIFAFKSYPVLSDENIYINMANAVKNGLIPYKDFFYAHPPLPLFILSSFFNFFGNSWIIAKIYQTSIAILILLASRSLFNPLFVLLSPLFILFGNLQVGFWESLLFLILSFKFLINKKEFLASILFSLSVYSRILSIFFIIPLLILSKKKFKFFFYSLIFCLILFLPHLFYKEFFDSTIFYHLKRFSLQTSFDWQYWLFGIFNVPVYIIASFISYKQNKKIFLIIVFSFAYEIFLNIFLKMLIYHYFIISLVGLGFAYSVLYKKYKLLAFFPLILNLISNYQNFFYYFNPQNFSEIVEIEKFFENVKNKTIFGDPITTNYVSFKTGLKIQDNVFDTDLKRIRHDPKEIIDALSKNPDFIIDNNFNSYISLINIADKYRVAFKTEHYFVYEKIS